MRAVDIIMKKRSGLGLSKAEIEFFIRGYVEGSIPDYQASALLMAIYFKGMEASETAFLTMAMLDSGETMDLSGLSPAPSWTNIPPGGWATKYPCPSPPWWQPAAQWYR